MADHTLAVDDIDRREVLDGPVAQDAPLAAVPPVGPGIFSLARNSISVSFFSSALMLTRAKGLSFKRSTISRSWGIICLHGPHQVAQMSRERRLPLEATSVAPYRRASAI